MVPMLGALWNGLRSILGKKEGLSREAFTQLYVERARKAFPETQITQKDVLEVEVVWGEDDTNQCYLDNCYSLYLQGEDALEVIDLYVYQLQELREFSNTSLDRDLIVPVVKDREWVTGAESMAEKGMGFLKRELNSELMVVYAEDLPSQLRYLGGADLEGTGVTQEELPQLAASNLMRLLPEWEIHGHDGFYMVTAGGTFEASLIAVPEFWEKAALEVQGDYVVGVPARDLLLVTGSENPADVDRLKAMVKERFPGLSYPLVTDLFLVKDGDVRVYEG